MTLLLSFVGGVLAVFVTFTSLATALSYSGVTISTATTVTASPFLVNLCTVNPVMTVDVTAMNTNAGAGTIPLVFLLNTSTVTSQNYLLLKGFTTAAAANSATRPFLATITHNTFVSGLIGFYNHFPAGSVIDVRHNACNQIRDPPFTTEKDHYHFFGAVGVGLRGFSKLLIEQNDIVVSHSSVLSVQGMLITKAYFLSQGSVWSLSNNKITVSSTNVGAWGVYMFLTTAAATVSDFSSLLYVNNTIAISSRYTAIFFISGHIKQTYSGGSTFDLSNNKMVLNGGSMDNCVVLIDNWSNKLPMAATGNSLIRFSRNEIKVTSTAGNIFGISLALMPVTAGSELSVSDNLLLLARNTGRVIGIHFKLDVTVSAGVININSNRVIACSNTLGLGYVTDGYKLGISAGGRLLFTMNTAERDPTCSAAGAFPLLSGPVVLSGTGKFYLCPWNRYGSKKAYNPSKDYTAAMVTSFAVATDKCTAPTQSSSYSLAHHTGNASYHVPPGGP